MKLKYKCTRSWGFGQAWNKVSNYAGYKNVATSIAISKMHKRLVEESKVCEEAAKKIALDLGEKDDKGEYMRPDGPESFKIPEAKQDEFKNRQEELNEQEFELPGKPIFIEELMAAGLSPADLVELEGILTDEKPPQLAAMKKD